MRDDDRVKGACVSCRKTVSIAASLKCGGLVYCERCGQAYILTSRRPLKLQVASERHLDMPWLDSYFI